MSSMYPSFGGQSLQRCIRCGTPLPPNMAMCGNCGTYNALPQANGSLGQAPSSSGVYRWDDAPAPTATPPANGQFAGWGQSGQPQYPASPNAFGQASPSQSFPPSNNHVGLQGAGQPAAFNNYATAQASRYYASPPGVANTYQPGSMNGFAPDRFYQPQPKKRAPKVGLIILIGVLVLVVISSGLAGLLYLKGQSQSTPTPTPTTIIVTPSITPLFQDSFANNNSRWDLTSSPGKFSVSVGGGSMALEDDQKTLLWEILPGKSFTDFRLDVDAILTKGDSSNGYGVFIRGALSQNGAIGLYYRFELYGDGTFAFFKGTIDANGNTQSSQVSKDTANAAIQQEGQVNHITIIAKGSNMTFLVNGTTVYTYSDASYKGGLVALFVSNLPNLAPGARAAFANLAIFPPG